MILLLACVGGRSIAEAEPGAAQVAGRLPPRPSGAVPPVPSAWSSPTCGARSWERRLELQPGGALYVQDRVSPCPPRVVCVWSGVVERRGAWALQDGELALDLEPVANTLVEPSPRHLRLDGAQLLDDLGCAYTTVPTEHDLQ